MELLPSYMYAALVWFRHRGSDGVRISMLC